MGFDRAWAKIALDRCGNDVGQAVDFAIAYADERERLVQAEAAASPASVQETLEEAVAALDVAAVDDEPDAEVEAIAPIGSAASHSREGRGSKRARGVSDSEAILQDSESLPPAPAELPLRGRRAATAFRGKRLRAAAPAEAPEALGVSSSPTPASSSSAGIPGQEDAWLRPGRRAPAPAAAAPSENTLAAFQREAEEEEADGAKEHAFRDSRSVSVGAPSHPDWLTEPAAVAEIALPRLPEEEILCLPTRVASSGHLSSPQLESVAYAARRFRARLPGGCRAGYYLGDGTGCGKGRVIAALIWHLWNQGVRRHVWLSASGDLLQDARRDLSDIGADIPVAPLSNWGYGPIGAKRGLDASGNGVLFVTYSLLVACRSARAADADPDAAAEMSAEDSRVGQLVEWMRGGGAAAGGGGGADGLLGLIALDEAHRAKNVGSATLSVDGFGANASRAAVSALSLQRALPDAAVLYVSATGATEIRHLGYLERLGLWGPGRPHRDFEELRGAVEAGGLAAMELVAMTMRAEGMLSCRSLSFRGTSFRLVHVPIAGRLHNTYVGACIFWQESLKFAMRYYKTRKIEVKAKKLKVGSSELKEISFHMRTFWGCQQQFFRQLLMCAKVDEAVALASAARLREEAVVISMWSTGEAVTQARMQREGPEAAATFASAPYEIGLRMLDKVLEPIAASTTTKGEEARKELAQLRKKLSALELPANPLDDLVARLGGPLEVAELTGRSRRPVRSAGGVVTFEDRPDGATLEEQRAFQSGQKNVAIITEAASAGISLHADNRLPQEGQRTRYMISIELPWEADKAIQQLGRVHRSNQSRPPRFAVLVTDLGGEVRFVSAVARRLRILGAMMRGDRNSAHGAVATLAAFDVQNRYGRRALSRFFELLRTTALGKAPDVDFSFVGVNRGSRSASGSPQRRWASWRQFAEEATRALELVGLRPDTADKHDESQNESKDLNVYMNRLLMLEPGIQNALFDAVAELYVQLVGVDRSDGTFDDGLESLDLQGRRRASVAVAARETVHRDAETGAETSYVRLRVDRGVSWAAAKQLLEEHCERVAEGLYWRQGRGSQREVVLAVAKPAVRSLRGAGGGSDDDDDEPVFDLHSPEGIRDGAVSRDDLMDEFCKVRANERDEAERVWKAKHAQLGDGRWREEHVLTGSILNTWAVLGSAITNEREPVARARAASKKIPLVRARLADGGAVVGVRVQPERLPEVRYALKALSEASEAAPLRVSGAKDDPAADDEGAMDGMTIQSLSGRLEAFLREQPSRTAQWQGGWAGAHEVRDRLLQCVCREMNASALS
eukprot:TRINITY_DN281_c0_g1_i2.p1 TRINITY_DN281_c0_g1~~TRINITY_DN281_c0_g1_i2.p1  ORF type:complete len:1359 (-),score=307.07 TRINITY_DN281_c0_g1_i2:51-3971(-)